MKILVVGDIMIDRTTHGTVSRVSPEAPVPILKYTHTTDVLGGAGNVANNVRTLGGDVTLQGCGDYAQELWPHNTFNYAPDIIKHRFMCGGHQMLRVDTETEYPRATIGALEADIIIVSDYGKGTITRGLMKCLKADIIIVDPKGSNWNKYGRVDWLTPNKAEWMPWTVDNMLITLGADGMSYNGTNIPSEAREVFDVTGAGDTVVAALAVALSRGMSNMDAVRWANKAAGIVVGKRGTSVVTLEEMEI